MQAFDTILRHRLDTRRAAHRYRQRSLVTSPIGAWVKVNGRDLRCFCSNDYLGLGNHPELIDAMQSAARSSGVGSGASHLVCGHSEQHHLLEQELAVFTGRERALLFGSGYMANIGVIAGLLSRGDGIFEDRLNHASLIDGGLLSGAKFTRFAHNNLVDLGERLKQSKAGHKLIAVDGVYSMDGDMAPLPALVEIARNHSAWLMVDDAHGLGCLGDHGGGTCQLFNLNQQQVPILMGTLGKAFGSYGAFVAGSDALIETLIQFSRTYIYTTALPPAVAAATRASLRLIVAGRELRAGLHQRIRQFISGLNDLGLPASGSQTAIQPLMLGDDLRALQWSVKLAEYGCWVSAIRPPTVPEGTARLRITLSAAHSEDDVACLLDGLAQCQRAGL